MVPGVPASIGPGSALNVRLMQMNLTAYGLTDPGRKRKNNEDALLIDKDLGLYIVADGMGGQAAGEVASLRTTQIIRDHVKAGIDTVRKLASDPSPENRVACEALIERAIHAACAEVFKMGESDPKLKGMGTTVDCLVVAGERAVIGHVGDSRVYLVRDGKAHRLTEDHTLVAAQVKSGALTKEQAARSPLRNVLTRAVGNQESVQVDTLLVDFIPGDRLLLCSDGLHGYIAEDEEVAALLGPLEILSAMPQKLVNIANDRGGKDNITALIIEVPHGAGAESEAGVKLDVLKKIPLFQHFSYKEQTAVVAIAESHSFAAGTNIVVEGDPGGDLFIVLRGKVAVMKGEVEISSLVAGSHFGEMGLVEDAKRSATVRAVLPTRVLIVRKADIMNLMRKESVLAVKLLWSFVQVLSQRLRAANTELSEALQELTASQSAAPFAED